MTLAVKLEKRYTYQDYLKWPDEERWEIIGGEAYDMSPAPTTRHQMVVARLHLTLAKAFGKSPCTVFIAPTDVVLSEYDVVQPDVFIVCDGKKITEQNIQGATDLVIEVLSPNTALKDKREKKRLYEKSGVKEYIIVDPVEQYVERFFLESDGLYGHADIIGPKEIIKLKAFDNLVPAYFKQGIEIPLWEVFEIEPPENIG